MWLYFLERKNEKVVILSNHLLLDMTRETQEALEKFNIRYTLSHPYVEDFEYAERVWKLGGYEIVGIEWLVGVVVGWHCGIEEKPKAQPFQRYEDIFNKQKRGKPKRNIEEETEKKKPAQTSQATATPEMGLEQKELRRRDGGDDYRRSSKARGSCRVPHLRVRKGANELLRRSTKRPCEKED
jgi:hypothetical protein